VLTNNLLSAPARGYGSQQANFGMESIVAKAIHELGLDPVETRRRNLSTRHGPGGAKTLEGAARGVGSPPEAEPGWLTGRGVATISAKYGYPAGFVDRAIARVSVDDTGRFLVEADLIDAGTGSTVEAQRLVARALDLDSPPDYAIAADALADPTGGRFMRGRPPSRLRLELFQALEGGQLLASRILFKLLAGADPELVRRLGALIARPVNLLGAGANALKTALFPDGLDSYIPRTAGSRGVLMTGRAVVDAAGHLRIAARGLAAKRFAVDPTAVALDGQGAHVASDPSRALSWAELAGAAGGRLVGVGRSVLPHRALLDPATGSQAGTIDAMPATHVCDVAVHPESGEVRILNYVACHDVGRVLSPRVVRGQVLGGIAMGVGQALFERLRVTDGRVTSTGLRDYLVPTTLDVPSDVEVEIVEGGDGLGPFFAKGIGEAAAVAAPPAIANAVYEALGKQITEIPATPDLIPRP
jgi:CO/xanthine dehydrogenase Mo-binding subunit